MKNTEEFDYSSEEIEDEINKHLEFMQNLDDQTPQEKAEKIRDHLAIIDQILNSPSPDTLLRWQETLIFIILSFGKTTKGSTEIELGEKRFNTVESLSQAVANGTLKLPQSLLVMSYIAQSRFE